MISIANTNLLAKLPLNIDLADPDRDPARRIALELTADAARALVAAIQEALAAVPEELRGQSSLPGEP